MTWRPLLPAARPRSGEAGTIVRFAVVGLCATASYLAVSMLLLDWRWSPGVVNIVAFLVSLAVSYLGHYFFTYREQDDHLRVGSRFVVTTTVLCLACAGFHYLVLALIGSPQVAALFVAIAYPPLSFLANHLIVFDRGRIGR